MRNLYFVYIFMNFRTTNSNTFITEYEFNP